MKFFDGKIIYPILDLDFCNSNKIDLFEILNLWKKFPQIVEFFQFRAKSISESEYLKIYLELKKNTNLPIIINDYFELALKEKSFGLHLGKEDFLSLSESDKNKIENSEIILKGTSSHSFEDLIHIQNQFWNYTGFGPIFSTNTKISNYSTLGIEPLKQAISFSKIPLVPIGGINSTNFKEVFFEKKTIPASISALVDEKMFFNLLDFIDNK